MSMSQPEEKSGWSWGFLETAVLVCIIGFLAWVAAPNFIKDGHNSPILRCINNMRQLDGAINVWAAEKGITKGTVITGDDIKPYLKLGPDGRLPKCPSGGKYIFGKIVIYPQVICSLGTNVTPAHVLP